MPATGVHVGHMMSNKPVSDTMPRRGKVTDLCKEWLVHEDGALAYQLQQQEVQKHYNGNKSRNAIVREDIPMARAEQQRVEQEAFEEHVRQVALLEEHDARVARRIAEQIEREEEEQRIRLEAYDKKIARCIQEKEKRLVGEGDVNSVGLPLPPSPKPPMMHGRSRATMVEVEERFRRLQPSTSSSDECSGGEVFAWPPPPDSDQMSRASQEKQDEELAKRLQEEEANAGLDPIDRDRLLAIEVQDSELARMLQEKEKARVKRAKEKARAKALAKKQLDEVTLRLEAERLQSAAVSPPPPATMAAVPPSHNIATAIDPTYSPGSSANSTMTRSSLSYPADSGYVLDQLADDYHPPYMPVQGQRRPLSGEKKKKKGKEAECKQQ